jgi:hypothetical protein
MAPETDLAAQMIALMKDWGPVHAGCSAGDFNAIPLEAAPGWVVTSHHNDILTYVGSDEVGEDAEDLRVGLLGRSRRDQDAQDLHVIRVEDKRDI